VPADFEANVTRLEELYTRFVEMLRTATLETFRRRTAAAYGDARRLTYSLGYHQAIHLAVHYGRIRTILTCAARCEESRRASFGHPRIRTGRRPSSMAAMGLATSMAWQAAWWRLTLAAPDG
jgi:hypothetical protein